MKIRDFNKDEKHFNEITNLKKNVHECGDKLLAAIPCTSFRLVFSYTKEFIGDEIKKKMKNCGHNKKSKSCYQNLKL